MLASQAKLHGLVVIKLIFLFRANSMRAIKLTTRFTLSF